MSAIFNSLAFAFNSNVWVLRANNLKEKYKINENVL